MTLNDRELATVLAALRQRQQQMEYNEVISCWDPDLREITTDGDRLTPLTVVEINELCKRLNVRPGSKEAVLSHFGAIRDDVDLDEQLARIRVQRLNGVLSVTDSPDEVKDAVMAVMLYHWEDERRDAQEHFHTTGTVSNHIFSSLVVLDNWLSGLTTTPESYLDDDEETDDDWDEWDDEDDWDDDEDEEDDDRPIVVPK